MTYDKKAIAKQIEWILSKRKVDGRKLDLFMKELVVELERDPLSDMKFEETLSAIVASSMTLKENINDDTKALLRKFESFQEYYFLKKQAISQINPFLSKASFEYEQRYNDLSLHEQIEQFENSLEALINGLKIDLEFQKKKAGRPKQTKYDSFIKKIFVMAECLLNVKATKTATSTDFSKIIYYCLSIVEGENKEIELDSKFSRLIGFCFDDLATVQSLAVHYKRYGRLDLYVEHAKRSGHAKAILKTFEVDWDEWEKPNNFQLLSS